MPLAIIVWRAVGREWIKLMHVLCCGLKLGGWTDRRMTFNHLHIAVLEHLAFLTPDICTPVPFPTLRPVRRDSPLVEKLTCLE